MSPTQPTQPNSEQLLETATTFLDVGMPKTALPYLQELVQRRPWSAAAHASLADAHHDVDDHTKALAALQAAIAIEPNNPDLHINAGLTHIALQNPNAALNAFSTALRLRPDDLTTLITLGATLHQLGRHFEAVHPLERALTLSPDPNIAIRLGGVYIALERYADAHHVLATVPDNDPLAALYLAAIAIIEGHHRDAIPIIARANRLAPASPTFLDILAALQHQLGRPFYAQATINKAVALLDHINDPHKHKILAHRTAVNIACLNAETAIAIQPTQLAYSDVYHLTPEEARTDPNCFQRYIACITTDQGALLQALNHYGHDILEHYNQGLRAIDCHNYSLAAEHFRTVYEHCQNDPIICNALITAFDMAEAYTDADIATIQRDALQDHPKTRATTLYREGISAVNQSDFSTAIETLHAIDSLDQTLAEHLRQRIQHTHNPDSLIADWI